MREPVGYGIDFGTTNSLIAVAYADGVEVVPIGGAGMSSAEECLPSIVYFDHDSHRFAGVEAVQQYVVTAKRRVMCSDCLTPGGCTTYDAYKAPRPRGMKRGPAPRCAYSRLAYGLKQDLADEAFAGTESWGRRFSLEDMCSWIFAELASEASASGRVGSVPVVVGAPVEFERERQTPAGRKVALERLAQSARMVGLEAVEFLSEPEAALQYEKYELGSPAADPIAVAVDFGGGTFDVAVSSKRASPWSSTATAGVSIGGERFDGYLFREYLLPELGLERADERLLRRLSSLRHMAMNAGRNELSEDLASLKARGGASSMHKILESGFVYGLWKSIQDAKIGLSENDQSYIDFHKAGVDIRVPVARDDFEALIREDLSVLRQTILQALLKANASPNDVSVVLRTGGSSSIPAFIEMLHELFPNAVVTEQPTMTTIVTGLAHRAREIAGVTTLRAAQPSQLPAEPEHARPREMAHGRAAQTEKAAQAAPTGLVERLKRMMRGD